MLEVNTYGALVVARAFAPAMVAAGRGGLVFTASLAGLLPVPGLSVYCASKHAVMGLADSMRLELHRAGVTVTTLCPGYVPTGLHRNTRYTHPSLERFMEGQNGEGGVAPEVVARRTVDAALAGRPRVIIGAEKLGLYLRRLSPTVYDGAAARLGWILDRL